jgi:hypothetical protein
MKRRDFIALLGARPRGRSRRAGRTQRKNPTKPAPRKRSFTSALT